MTNLPTRQDAVNAASPEGATDADVAAGTDGASAGDAIGDLVALVFRLDGLLRAAGDRLAGPAGQTTARWRILATAENGPMTVAQIAADWSLARQSVQRVADLLARDGLIAYEDNPSHRRAQLVRLTPAGASALQQIRAAQGEWATAVAGRVGTAEVQSANTTLARVIAALTDTD